MKYAEYLKKTGLTNKEVIALLNPHFPKFTKIQCSMLTHPDQYGLQLTAAAKAKLPPVPTKQAAKRKKPNRLVVYLDDEQYTRLMAKKGGASTQQYLESVLTEDK